MENLLKPIPECKDGGVMNLYRRLFPHRHPMSKLDAEAWVLLGVIVISGGVVIALVR